MDFGGDERRLSSFSLAIDGSRNYSSKNLDRKISENQAFLYYDYSGRKARFEGLHTEISSDYDFGLVKWSWIG